MKAKLEQLFLSGALALAVGSAHAQEPQPQATENILPHLSGYGTVHRAIPLYDAPNHGKPIETVFKNVKLPILGYYDNSRSVRLFGLDIPLPHTDYYLVRVPVGEAEEHGFVKVEDVEVLSGKPQEVLLDKSIPTETFLNGPVATVPAESVVNSSPTEITPVIQTNSPSIPNVENTQSIPTVLPSENPRPPYFFDNIEDIPGYYDKRAEVSLLPKINSQAAKPLDTNQELQIVWHHTATEIDRQADGVEVCRGNGWDQCPYHVIVRIRNEESKQGPDGILYAPFELLINMGQDADNPIPDQAYHAAEYNDESFGISYIGGSDAITPPSEDVVNTMMAISIWLSQKYNIPVENIIGHKEIAAHKKPDPAGLDMDQIRSKMIEVYAKATEVAKPNPDSTITPPENSEVSNKCPLPALVTGFDKKEQAKYEKVLPWCDQIVTVTTSHSRSVLFGAAWMMMESTGDPNVIHPVSGAVGLYQIMPRDTHNDSSCINPGCYRDRPTTQELLDPQFNIDYAFKTLDGMNREYGNERDGLMHYGPQGVGYTYVDQISEWANLIEQSMTR